VRQTWGLGGGSEAVDGAQNQLSGTRDKRRIVLTVGKLAVTDIFDANTYSHDARSQFMTWASLAQGSYDFVADSQGYTWGASLEYIHDDWALRVGRFVAAQESNGQSLNFAIGRYHGDQIEIEHAHELGGRPRVIRVLLWNNREFMGRFADAIDFARRNGARAGRSERARAAPQARLRGVPGAGVERRHRRLRALRLGRWPDRDLLVRGGRAQAPRRACRSRARRGDAAATPSG